MLFNQSKQVKYGATLYVASYFTFNTPRKMHITTFTAE